MQLQGFAALADSGSDSESAASEAQRAVGIKALIRGPSEAAASRGSTAKGPRGGLANDSPEDHDDEESDVSSASSEEEDEVSETGCAAVPDTCDRGSELDVDSLSVEQLRDERGVVCQYLPEGAVLSASNSSPVLRLGDLVGLGVREELVTACRSCAKGASLTSAIQSEVWGALLRPCTSSGSARGGEDPAHIAVPDSEDDEVPSAAHNKVEGTPAGCHGVACIVVEDFDIVGVAPTGSGKTLAFLLPLLADGLCSRSVSIRRLPDLLPQLQSIYEDAFPTDQGHNSALLEKLCALSRRGDKSTFRLILGQVASKAAAGDGVVPAVWRQLLDACDAVDLVAPAALVLSPTRELAQQVGDVAVLLGASAMVILGGVDHRQQRDSLMEAAPALVVATPGRLLAICGRWPSSARARREEKLAADPEASLCLRSVARLVLDEADRLLDEGFEEDIRVLANLASRRRQTMLFSATWSSKTEGLAAILRPTVVHIAVSGVPPSIEQQVLLLPRAARAKTLRKVLHELPKGAKVLCFVLFKKEAKELSGMLEADGILAWPLQGDMSQGARTAAMQNFRNAAGAACTVLVATDVAARGLDVPDVTHVINFSFGLSNESYVHRIGRCGRAGRRGKAITFVTDGDERFAPYLLQVLRQAKQRVPQGLSEMADLYVKSDGSAKLSVIWDSAGEVRVVVKGARHPEAAAPSKGKGKGKGDASTGKGRGKASGPAANRAHRQKHR